MKSVAEQGVDGFEVTAWTAMYAPRGTPKEIVDRLNAEVVKILAQPEIRQRLLQLGFEPASGTPEQLAAFEKTGARQVGPADQGGRAEGGLSFPPRLRGRCQRLTLRRGVTRVARHPPRRTAPPPEDGDGTSAKSRTS